MNWIDILIVLGVIAGFCVFVGLAAFLDKSVFSGTRDT